MEADRFCVDRKKDRQLVVDFDLRAPDETRIAKVSKILRCLRRQGLSAPERHQLVGGRGEGHRAHRRSRSAGMTLRLMLPRARYFV